MSRPSISLCMIVKNEERFLARCLKSVEGLVEEIIIVDTGSSDNTKEIAESFGAKIYAFEWVNDFSKARNEALKYAQSDYILVLDADEYLESRDQLLLLLESLQKDVYFLSIKSFLRGGISTIHPVIRLFRNVPELKFIGKIHEQIIIPGDSLFTQDYLEVTINHDGYMKDVITEKNKEQRNLKILLEDLKEQETGFGLFNLGIQYKMMAEYEQAIKMFERAFPLSIEYSYMCKLITSLIQCYMELEQFDKALVICHESIEAYPNYTDLYYLQGQIYESLHYINDASESFNHCLKMGDVKNHELMTFHGVGSYMALTSLAGISLRKGDMAQAVQKLTDSLRINKHYMPSIKLLLDITKNTPFKDAFEFISKTWGITSIEDLKELIGVLYKLRHPFLYGFCELYNNNVDKSILAAGYLYSKRYNEAASIWYEIERIVDEDELEDVILYSILTKDKTLIQKYKHNLSLREKDYKLIIRCLEREELNNNHWTKDIEQLLVKFFEKLIQLHEFDTIDYFVSQMTSYNLQFSFAKTLASYGFVDIAINIMDIQLPNVDREALVWIADQLAMMGNYNESMRFYEFANEQGASFNVLESMYQICIKINDNYKRFDLIQAMKQFTPKSKWANKLEHYNFLSR
ncbi:Tetratricopeptide repeat-containing protein [Paenibacillus sp. cl141a]|uniref:tetratricopeptide repeat-containing glycosyltransferase family 2 protein n=1 Tax=Paenibacillus sp. cl141a TaxID=1761877 RepID=UPI0008B02B8B|nr:glycosyltransferase family 2 protein [Paenibacillus sp. cl141a]SEL32533.1 Tetratricopeptide repeat-containing protein [Paenibacillus sp. cl141a]